MLSQRHNDDQSGSGEPSAADGYLDAARACILDVGWRRTTLTEVARRAGVSRMTIYRTWPDMAALMADLMTREWAEISGAARTGAEAAPTPEAIADGVVATIAALRSNELFARILTLDPELVLPYLLDRRGRSQDAVLAVLTAGIEAGQQAKSIRAGDPTTIARSLVLTAHGHALSARTMATDGITEADLDAELHHLVERGLRP